ncbi:hypothetical protein B296_00050353, partial [Ensete ventricosum]
LVFPTLRIQTYDEEASNQQLRKNLNLLEEKRADAHLRTLAYRRAVTKLYNCRGKVAPNWEGPYRVVEVVREGTWHISNRQKIYA